MAIGNGRIRHEDRHRYQLGWNYDMDGWEEMHFDWEINIRNLISFQTSMSLPAWPSRQDPFTQCT